MEKKSSSEANISRSFAENISVTFKIISQNLNVVYIVAKLYYSFRQLKFL